MRISQRILKFGAAASLAILFVTLVFPACSRSNDAAVIPAATSAAPIAGTASIIPVPTISTPTVAPGTATTNTKPAATATTSTSTPAAAVVTSTAPVYAGTSYPLVVGDLLGRAVKVAQKPVRIVCLSPTATETLYALGGTAVGRDTASKYPPEALSVPTVGSSFNPSVESVAALKPDLIIMEALNQSYLVVSFEQLGVPVLVLRAASLGDVEQSFRILGAIIDKNQAAAQAISGIENRLVSARKTLNGVKDVLILIADANRNIYAARPNSYAGALLSLLGQNNLADGMPENGPYPGYTLYTGEQAMKSNPDFIFAISPAPAPAPNLSSMLPQIPGFNTLSIVVGGKVKEIDPALFLQDPGPRMADAVEQLAALIAGTGK